MAMEYFCAYHSYLEWIVALSDEERGRLFSALLAYSVGNELPELGEKDGAIFPAMKWNIDRDKKAYAEKCEKNRRNGAKGGERPPNATERPPNAPQGKGEGKGKGKVNPPLSEGEDIRARAREPRPRFLPPTVEEVAEYVKQRGSRVDPQGFVDFYTAKGWMVGKTPMKDWKAACRNAENWERWSQKAPKGFQPGKQPSPETDERAKASMERLRQRMKQEGTP